MQLLLIRHGLPEHIVKRDGSPADPPLSAEGRAQAEALAKWLEGERIDALYSSPLQRALQTAEPLSKRRGLELKIEPDVREMDAEAAEYIPLEKLKATDYAAWQAAMAGGLYAHLDIDVFRRTVSDAIERIIAANPGGRVAVFCHGGVVNSWAAHILKLDEPLFFDPTYTSVNRFLAAKSGERSIASLNEAAHLRLLSA